MTDSIGRIPVVVVEIQQPICQNTYGSSPCTAAIGTTGTRKCFNTRATCQDPDNYDQDGDPIYLRFGKASADLPNDLNIIPSIQSVSTVPTRINVGGRLGKEKPLGLRAESNILLVDHPHSDNIVDPYLSERTYNPLELGTFWSKWLKRNPYNEGLTLIVYEGYSGQTLAEMQSRLYNIDKIEGPDSNNQVKIKAKDILRLADNNKAQYPALTVGKLTANITDSATSLELDGAVEADYTAYSSNYIRINNEIIGYTSVTTDGSGNLDFTGLTRGQFGTEAAAHEEDDTAQACVYYNAVAPWLIVKDVLIDAGVPSSYIDYTAWTDEATTWLGGLTVTNILSEPTGVNTIVGELCEQCSFYVWFDERDREVKFQAIKPAVDEVEVITEENNLVQGSTVLTARPELRASEIWVSYIPRDSTQTRKERGNFRRTAVRVEAENLFPERKVYELYSRWLNSDQQVDLLTFRLLARYSEPPVYIRFVLDAKDRSLKVGDPFDIEYRGFTDDTGAIERRRYQVISSHESPPGENIVIEAQVFDYAIDFNQGQWMVDAAPDYSAATPAEKAAGGWWSDDDGTVEGEPGYVWS